MDFPLTRLQQRVIDALKAAGCPLSWHQIFGPALRHERLGCQEAVDVLTRRGAIAPCESGVLMLVAAELATVEMDRQPLAGKAKRWSREVPQEKRKPRGRPKTAIPRPESRGGALQIKTHCRHGHPWTEENTYLNNNRSRECKLCKRAYMREYMRRRAAARKALNHGHPVPR